MKTILTAGFILALSAGISPSGASQSFATPPVPTAVERFLDLRSDHLRDAACCKTCRKGKACGNSCISRDKTCRKGVGCACDG